jgi:hypothetical protein
MVKRAAHPVSRVSLFTLKHASIEHGATRQARSESVAIGALHRAITRHTKRFFEPAAAASRAKAGLASSHAVSIDTDHVEARI